MSERNKCGICHEADLKALIPVCDPCVTRVSVCVNACRTISTAALEAGVVGKMLTVFRYQLQLRQPNLTTEERTKISTHAHEVITEVLDLVKNEGRGTNHE